MTKKKEERTDTVPEYTTNVNGVRIKKCCASCAFKQPLDYNGAHRLCTLGGGEKVVFKGAVGFGRPEVVELRFIPSHTRNVGIDEIYFN